MCMHAKVSMHEQEKSHVAGADPENLKGEWLDAGV